MQAHLFSPLTIKDVTFKNRIAVSPMCQYSSHDGFASSWHLVHLGSRAIGGAGLIFSEATAVSAEGRISPQDLGIWKDEHCTYLEEIVNFIHAQGSIAGIQLAHAGRKASTMRPWDGHAAIEQSGGGWQPLAPSALAFAPSYAQPREMMLNDILDVSKAFARASARALKAGFKVIEIHAAHGYLLHEFLSPLSNQRTDDYGGSFAHRIRLLLEVVKAVKSEWPASLPLFVRLSASDWISGAWDIEQTVELVHILKEHGVDVIDASSGGIAPEQKIPVGPGYQSAFAERIRRETQITTAAVGLITSAQQADHIIRSGQADMVLLAREMLRNPYWPLQAAHILGHNIAWPVQYARAS